MRIWSARLTGQEGHSLAGHTLSQERVWYSARPHDFRGVLPPKRICALHTMRPGVHSYSATTISQNNQLHCITRTRLSPESVRVWSARLGGTSRKQLTCTANNSQVLALSPTNGRRSNERDTRESVQARNIVSRDRS